MADPLDDLMDLLVAARESLSVELKQSTHPEGIAKIARGCIALRNKNAAGSS